MPVRERVMRHRDAVERVAILAGSFDDLFAGAVGQFFRAEGVEIYGAGGLRGNLRWGGRLRRSVARSRGACEPLALANAVEVAARDADAPAG